MIAIAGGKGGCGKTTTALGVARVLAEGGFDERASRREASPRVVDLDVGMPNLHRLAGVEREPTLADVVRRGDDELAESREREERPANDGHGDRRHREARIQRDEHGVEVVPPPRATADVSTSTALAALPPAAGPTLLDCPAGAGPDAATPLRVADALLLVATDRRESLEDAAKTGRMAHSLGTTVLGAVVTRARDEPGRAARALPTGRLVGVPSTGAPLADATARERYATVAAWIEEWTRERRTADASPESEQRTARETVQRAQREPVQRNGRATERTEQAEERTERTALEGPETSDDRPLRRRRDRRSRRARGGAGARSSSRGGGGPSGRR